MIVPTPFRNLAIGATFRRSGQPALLLRKLTSKQAVVHFGSEPALFDVPGKEWVWPAESFVRRRRRKD
jgi:hypothetical protein